MIERRTDEFNQAKDKLASDIKVMWTVIGVAAAAGVLIGFLAARR